jgi:glutathione peroxidase
MARKYWITAGIIITTTLVLLIADMKGKQESIRQKILRKVYPVLIKLGSDKAVTSILENKASLKPSTSFYELIAQANSGNEYPLSQHSGKWIMVVNTASDCGYTGQYEELETLYKQMNGKLVILAFPANDFKQQEKGSDEEIATFCKVNYGVTFPLMKKTSVIKGKHQHPVFKWLSDPAKNGWCHKSPEWNFCKYLIDPEGTLVAYIPMKVSPLDPQMIKLIK